MKLPELLSFKGTANKSDWWLITILCLFIEAFAIAGCLLAASNISPPLSYLVLFLCGSVILVAFVATLAVSARRFRDLSMSPWHSFLYFIPYFGWVLVWIPCGFLPFRFPKRTKTRRRTVSNSSRKSTPS